MPRVGDSQLPRQRMSFFLMDPQCTKAAKVEIPHIVVGEGLQNDPGNGK